SVISSVIHLDPKIPGAIEDRVKHGGFMGRALTGEIFAMAPVGDTGSADDIGCSQPVGSSLKTFQKMSLLRSKDASLVAAPGTGDVGGFGVELLGGDHDLVVGAALSLVTCDDITVTEVPEAGWYELSFPGLKCSVGAELRDSEDLSVYQAGFTIVPADENLVARAELDGSWQRDSESL